MASGLNMGRRTGCPVVLLGLTMLALLIAVCGDAEPASLEQRAQSIDKSLICPVCPGETIDQAQVALAHQMRTVVREKLAEGWSREQVLLFFVERYGEGVLAAPPKEGFSLVAWVVPPGAAGGAAVLLFFVVRAMRRSARGTDGGGSSTEEELEPYLPLVDRELEIPRREPHGPDKRG